ncbi:helix-turn-helix domain-containing protein [Marinicellulosiphila megalodicopiae]|uniref:helix-turn-helix domain-containing protein n=1 Tax=Marinicellulosiphila megalodicopiae TaxID=2724896 RepID=UPI003BB02075
MINRAVKIIRQYNEYTQLELSEILGVSKLYVSEIESGKKPMDSDILLKYSNFFDVPVSSLIFFSDSIKNKKKNNISNKVRVGLGSKLLDVMEWVVERNESKKKV